MRKVFEDALAGGASPIEIICELFLTAQRQISIKNERIYELEAEIAILKVMKK